MTRSCQVDRAPSQRHCLRLRPGAGCYLAWLIRDVLVLLYVSALFAVVLAPLVRFTRGFALAAGSPSKARRLFLLLGVAAALTAFGFLALPPVIRDSAGVRPGDARAPARAAGEAATHSLCGQIWIPPNISSRLQDFASQAATYLLLSHQGLGGQALRCHHGLCSHHLFHSGRRPRLSVVSFVLSRRTARSGWTRRCSGRRSAWASGCSARAA